LIGFEQMNAFYAEPLCETLAEQPDWQVAKQIDANNAIDTYTPQIAMDGHGNAVAVWTQTNGQRTSAWTNCYLVDQGWDTAMPLAIDHGRSTDAPHIAMNAQGNAIAIWIQTDNTGGSVWVRRYSIVTGWGSAELLETEQAHNPTIAINASGVAIALWQQMKGAHSCICSSSYIPGSGWSKNELLHICNHGLASRLQLATHSSGNAVLVWYQFDGRFYRIWAKHHLAGAGWCATQRLVDNVGDAFSPQVCMHTDGTVVAVWYQDDGICNGIWASECDTSRSWSTPELINDHAGSDALDPHIAPDSQGCSHVVWSQFDGEHDLIWVNRHVPGVGWDRPELIQSDSTGTAGHAQIAADASGKVYVLWTQSDGRRDHLVGSHYTQPSGWSSPQRLAIQHTGDAMLAQLAVNANGNAMAVWQQHDGVGNTVMAAIYGVKNYFTRTTKK
jgi:hypothetical protein